MMDNEASMWPLQASCWAAFLRLGSDPDWLGVKPEGSINSGSPPGMRKTLTGSQF